MTFLNSLVMNLDKGVSLGHKGTSDTSLHLESWSQSPRMPHTSVPLACFFKLMNARQFPWICALFVWVCDGETSSKSDPFFLVKDVDYAQSSYAGYKSISYRTTKFAQLYKYLRNGKTICIPWWDNLQIEYWRKWILFRFMLTATIPHFPFLSSTVICKRRYEKKSS